MDVDTTKCTCFHNIFRAVVDDISEGIYDIQYAATDGHWVKCSKFLMDVSLDPLLISYRDIVSILNAFARKYRTGDFAPSKYQVQTITVEDAAT